jgi:hypothetical protein
LTSAPAAKRSRRKKPSPEPAPQSSKTWTDAEKHAIAQAKTSGLGLYSIVVKIDPHCAMPIAARQLIQNSVREIGRVLVLRPDTKSPAASKQVEFVLASTQSKEQIAAKCHIPTIVGDSQPLKRAWRKLRRKIFSASKRVASTTSSTWWES